MDATFDEIRSRYQRLSPDGPDHFGEMLEKATTLMDSEPHLSVDELRRIAMPTLVLVGDDDLTHLAHTIELYEALPAGRLAVVPAASHMVAIEHADLVGRIIGEFLESPDPPQTMMPSRRAESQPSGNEPA